MYVTSLGLEMKMYVTSLGLEIEMYVTSLGLVNFLFNFLFNFRFFIIISWHLSDRESTSLCVLQRNKNVIMGWQQVSCASPPLQHQCATMDEIPGERYMYTTSLPLENMMYVTSLLRCCLCAMWKVICSNCFKFA